VSSLRIGKFFLSSPSNEFVNNFIDVWNEDVLYYWTNRASMSISKASKPFGATKEMRHVIVHALINVCSKIGSFITDLSTSTSMCYSLKNSFIISTSKNLSDHLSPCKQHCQDLAKPWAPHPSFEDKYGGFYGGARASHWSGHAQA
jgi:hypothetical protein